jgi:uncharacterized Zn finger protein
MQASKELEARQTLSGGVEVVRAKFSSKSKELEFLQSRSKGELLDLVNELAERYPDVGRFLRERTLLKAGGMDELVESLRHEIAILTDEPVWSRSWDDRSCLPDYSHLQEQFEGLANENGADALLELGQELLEQSHAQLEEADDEGETCQAIEDCMRVVLRALPKSSLSAPEQLLWYIERESKEEYSILGSKETFLKEGHYSAADWREVALRLEERLAGDDAGRWDLKHWQVRAYEESGWTDRIIPFYKREKDYVNLVEALLKEGKRDEARQNCILGCGKSLEKDTYTFEKLHNFLRDMAEDENRHDLAAAYRSDDFWAQPSVESYIALWEAAEKAKCWPAVREAVLHFLETGIRPDLPDARKKKAQDLPWPLPPTEVAHFGTVKERFHQRAFPERELLIRVAILEKRPDAVVELYRPFPKERSWNKWDTPQIHDEVAQAVIETHPSVALDIWQTHVDWLIGMQSPGHLQGGPALSGTTEAPLQRTWPRRRVESLHRRPSREVQNEAIFNGSSRRRGIK